jgi:hypothetical protein
MEFFNPQPLFFGGPGGFSGAAVFGYPGRRRNKGLHAGKGPLQVGPLGSFLVGSDNKFIVAAYTRSKAFPQPGRFRLIDPRQIRKVQPQSYLGIDLVDILPPGAARSGETGFSGGANGLA